MLPDDFAIGIDLERTYSCLAIWWNGNLVLIPNDISGRIIPLVSSFTKYKWLIDPVNKKQIAKIEKT